MLPMARILHVIVHSKDGSVAGSDGWGSIASNGWSSQPRSAKACWCREGGRSCICWCNGLDDWCCLHSGDWCWELLHNLLNLNPWHLPHHLLNHDPGHLPYNFLNDNLWHRHNFLDCLHLRNFYELSTICTCGTSTTFSTV